MLAGTPGLKDRDFILAHLEKWFIQNEMKNPL